jgi:hypothetical protein
VGWYKEMIKKKGSGKMKEKMTYTEFKSYSKDKGKVRMNITDNHFKTKKEYEELFLDDLKPLENFDKIEFIHPNDVINLLNWRDNNKDLVRKHNFPLEQGVIDSTFNGIKIIFKKLDDEVYLDCLMKNDEKFSHFLTFYWIYEDMQIRIIHPEKALMNENKDFYNEQCQSMITVFASLMAYMEHYKEHRELVKKKTIQSNKVKKKKNGKKKNIRKANKVIYSISVNEQSNTEKREYTLDETKSWNVRGHWRTMKDGKQIWIKPYKKGNKDGEEIPATYRL